ncbi:hypothetical protein F2Q69_00043156 [Brassica cretica]|uniref:Uncharacterized protein n=1 Tax=Brassica cretica TaxID=69181 RepID=A0A8S9NI20_BRACR|nr:hypothetical protein F2Q69_00043156 [Brassica cretica]
MESGNRYGGFHSNCTVSRGWIEEDKKARWGSEKIGVSGITRIHFGSGRERFTSWRKSSIPSIRIWISVIFKAISQIFRGMGSVNLKIRFWKIETKYKGINRRFPHTIVRKVWFTYWNLFDFLFGYRLVIEEITLRESGFSGDDLRSGGMSFGVYYIKCFGVEGRYEAGGLEDRARSYKGVVINGNSGQKNKERDHREYQGKGKGKMFEEPGSKWVKGAERDTKRYNSYNGGYRGDEGGSRHRSNHREATRALEDRVRFSRGLRRERNPLGRTGEEAREEGEVRSQGHRVPQKENMVLNSSLPSLAFQAQLALTQADPKEVLTDPLEGANGLDSIHESVEEMHALVVGEGMDLDAVLDKVVQERSIEELENEFQNLTDEEFEEDAKEKENGVDILEEENQGDEAEEKDQNAGDLVKKQGVRKKLYKPTVAAGGATMMRMVQAVRKRAAAKAGAKQTEEKGTSNPKSGPPKP